MKLSIVVACQNCHPRINCCNGNSVDLPVLLPTEVNNISIQEGKPINSFSIPSKGSLNIMKRSKNGCIFYNNNKCLIYSLRPFDCKLFPFDIRKNADGNYIIVCYFKHCQVDFNRNLCLEEAKKLLLPAIIPYIEEYATIRTPLVDSLDYEVVEELPKSLTKH